MVLIVGDEGVISEGALRVVGDNAVKSCGNFQGVIKTSAPSFNLSVLYPIPPCPMPSSSNPEPHQ